jgi:hypothetical protein
MSRLTEPLKHIRITGLSLFGIQVNLEDVLSGADVDERIKRLSGVRKELEAAVEAVGTLQTEALTRKSELDQLRTAVTQATQDREAAEKALAVPEEALARVMSRATATGRIRGILEGLIIGLLTGAASSYLIWYITKPTAVPGAG